MQKQYGRTGISISVPNNEWVTANGRYHWAKKATMTRALRTRAKFLAKRDRLKVQVPALLTVRVGYPTKARADMENAHPTVKALIDGLVDAGALPDDSSREIVATTWERGPKCEKGTHVVELIFTPQRVPF